MQRTTFEGKEELAYGGRKEGQGSAWTSWGLRPQTPTIKNRWENGEARNLIQFMASPRSKEKPLLILTLAADAFYIALDAGEIFGV